MLLALVFGPSQLRYLGPRAGLVTDLVPGQRLAKGRLDRAQLVLRHREGAGGARREQSAVDRNQ